VVAEGDLVAAEALGGGVEDSATEPRAERAIGAAGRERGRDDRVGVFAEDFVADAALIEPTDEGRAVVAGLGLIQVNGDELDREGQLRPQLGEQVEQGVAVLSAGDGDHDAVVGREQRVVFAGRAELSGQALFEASQFAHGWVSWARYSARDGWARAGGGATKRDRSRRWGGLMNTRLIAGFVLSLVSACHRVAPEPTTDVTVMAEDAAADGAISLGDAATDELRDIDPFSPPDPSKLPWEIEGYTKFEPNPNRDRSTAVSCDRPCRRVIPGLLGYGNSQICRRGDWLWNYSSLGLSRGNIVDGRFERFSRKSPTRCTWVFGGWRGLHE
jgi:hypothetical protein